MKKKPVTNERIISIIQKLQTEMGAELAKAEASLKKLGGSLDNLGKCKK